MEDYSKTIDELKLDKEFMERCKVELKKAMQHKIEEQIQILNKG
jgi:hypothetical protein